VGFLQLSFDLFRTMLVFSTIVSFGFPGQIIAGLMVVLRNEAGSKPQPMIPDYAGGAKTDDNPVLVVCRLKHF